MMKGVIVIQSEKCNGCHLCELACSSTKEGEYSLSKSRIRIVTNGLGGWSRPVVCLQCEDPMCLAVCTGEAIYRTTTPQGDNIVSVNKEKCIGCHQCVVACPFGAIEYLKEQKATKCDLCGGFPVCVDFCVYDCLKFIKLSDEDYQKRSAKLKALTTKTCRSISKRESYQRRFMASYDISKLVDV